MKLILLGLPIDRERLERLASRISALGHDARFRPFGGGTDAPESEEAGDDPAPVVLHCWTANSVGPDGARFQEDAVASKRLGAYRGLICDDVALPGAVRDAIDFRLSGDGDSDADRAAIDLVRQIEARLETGGGVSGQFDWIRRQVGQLLALARSNQRLLWIGGAAITGIGLLDASFSLMERLANRPSDEQRRIWAGIERQDRCEPFEDYIKRFGDDAPHAEGARYRLARERSEPAGTRSDPVEIGFAVPLGRQPMPLATAQQDVRARSTAEATAACRPFSVGLGGTGVPPRIVSIGEMDCTDVGAGYLCRASAIAECPTAKPVMRRLCPAGKPQEN